jgi:hypothetical protein
MLDVRRKENPCEIVFVSLEGANWDNTSQFGVLDHAPDVDIALETSAH